MAQADPKSRTDLNDHARVPGGPFPSPDLTPDPATAAESDGSITDVNDGPAPAPMAASAGGLGYGYGDATPEERDRMRYRDDAEALAAAEAQADAAMGLLRGPARNPLFDEAREADFTAEEEAEFAEYSVRPSSRFRELNQDQLHENQSLGEKSLRIAKRFAIGTAYETLGSLTGAVVGIGYALGKMDPAAFIDNDFNEWIFERKAELHENNQVYASSGYKDLNTGVTEFSTFLSHTMDSMSFVAGMVLAGYATAGVGSYLSAAAGVSRAGWLSRVGNAGKTLAKGSGLDEVLGSVRAANSFAAKLGVGIPTAGHFVGRSITGGAWEAITEAHGVSGEIKRSLLAQGLTEEEADDMAHDAAMTSFWSNYWLTSATNAINLPQLAGLRKSVTKYGRKHFRNVAKKVGGESKPRGLGGVAANGGFRGVGKGFAGDRATGKIRFNSETGVYEVAKQGKIKAGFSVGSGVAVQAGSEAFEEYFQGSLNGGLLNYYSDVNSLAFVSDALSHSGEVWDYFKEFHRTAEGRQAMFQGALLGFMGFVNPAGVVDAVTRKEGERAPVMMGGIAEVVRERRADFAKAERLVESLNGLADGDGPIMRRVVLDKAYANYRANVMQASAREAFATGDTLTGTAAEASAMFALLRTYHAVGAGDVVAAQADSLREADEGQVRSMFPTETADMDATEVAEYRDAAADRIAEANEKYGEIASGIDRLNPDLDPRLREELIHKLMLADSVTAMTEDLHTRRREAIANAGSRGVDAEDRRAVDERQAVVATVGERFRAMVDARRSALDTEDEAAVESNERFVADREALMGVLEDFDRQFGTGYAERIAPHLAEATSAELLGDTALSDATDVVAELASEENLLADRLLGNRGTATPEGQESAHESARSFAWRLDAILGNDPTDASSLTSAAAEMGRRATPVGETFAEQATDLYRRLADAFSSSVTERVESYETRLAEIATELGRLSAAAIAPEPDADGAEAVDRGREILRTEAAQLEVLRRDLKGAEVMNRGILGSLEAMQPGPSNGGTAEAFAEIDNALKGQVGLLKRQVALTARLGQATGDRIAAEGMERFAGQQSDGAQDIEAAIEGLAVVVSEDSQAEVPAAVDKFLATLKDNGVPGGEAFLSSVAGEYFSSVSRLRGAEEAVRRSSDPRTERLDRQIAEAEAFRRRVVGLYRSHLEAGPTVLGRFGRWARNATRKGRTYEEQIARELEGRRYRATVAAVVAGVRDEALSALQPGVNPVVEGAVEKAADDLSALIPADAPEAEGAESAEAVEGRGLTYEKSMTTLVALRRDLEAANPYEAEQVARAISVLRAGEVDALGYHREDIAIRREMEAHAEAKAKAEADAPGEAEAGADPVAEDDSSVSAAQASPDTETGPADGKARAPAPDVVEVPAETSPANAGASPGDTVTESGVSFAKFEGDTAAAESAREKGEEFAAVFKTTDEFRFSDLALSVNMVFASLSGTDATSREVEITDFTQTRNRDDAATVAEQIEEIITDSEIFDFDGLGITRESFLADFASTLSAFGIEVEGLAVAPAEAPTEAPAVTPVSRSTPAPAAGDGSGAASSTEGANGGGQPGTSATSGPDVEAAAREAEIARSVAMMFSTAEGFDELAAALAEYNSREWTGGRPAYLFEKGVSSAFTRALDTFTGKGQTPEADLVIAEVARDPNAPVDEAAIVERVRFYAPDWEHPVEGGVFRLETDADDGGVTRVRVVYEATPEAPPPETDAVATASERAGTPPPAGPIDEILAESRRRGEGRKTKFPRGYEIVFGKDADFGRTTEQKAAMSNYRIGEWSKYAVVHRVSHRIVPVEGSRLGVATTSESSAFPGGALAVRLEGGYVGLPGQRINVGMIPDPSRWIIAGKRVDIAAADPSEIAAIVASVAVGHVGEDGTLSDEAIEWVASQIAMSERLRAIAAETGGLPAFPLSDLGPYDRVDFNPEGRNEARGRMRLGEAATYERLAYEIPGLVGDDGAPLGPGVLTVATKVSSNGREREIPVDANAFQFLGVDGRVTVLAGARQRADADAFLAPILQEDTPSVEAAFAAGANARFAVFAEEGGYRLVQALPTSINEGTVDGGPEAAASPMALSLSRSLTQMREDLLVNPFEGIETVVVGEGATDNGAPVGSVFYVSAVPTAGKATGETRQVTLAVDTESKGSKVMVLKARMAYKQTPTSAPVYSDLILGNLSVFASATATDPIKMIVEALDKRIGAALAEGKNKEFVRYWTDGNSVDSPALRFRGIGTEVYGDAVAELNLSMSPRYGLYLGRDAPGDNPGAIAKARAASAELRDMVASASGGNPASDSAPAPAAVTEPLPADETGAIDESALTAFAEDLLDSDPGPELFEAQGERAAAIPVTASRARQRLREILPESVRAEFVDRLATGTGIEALGRFARGTIFLSARADERTVYHEALHAAFAMALTPDERAGAMAEAAASGRFPAPALADLAEIQSHYDAPLTRERLVEIYYEEAIARDFADYAVERDARKRERPSWLRRVFDAFARLLRRISAEAPELKRLYDDLYEGRLRERTSVIPDPATEMYSVITNGEGGYVGGQLTEVLHDRTLQRLSREIVDDGLAIDGRLAVRAREILDDEIANHDRAVASSLDVDASGVPAEGPIREYFYERRAANIRTIKAKKAEADALADFDPEQAQEVYREIEDRKAVWHAFRNRVTFVGRKARQTVDAVREIFANDPDQGRRFVERIVREARATSAVTSEAKAENEESGEESSGQRGDSVSSRPTTLATKVVDVDAAVLSLLQSVRYASDPYDLGPDLLALDLDPQIKVGTVNVAQALNYIKNRGANRGGAAALSAIVNDAAARWSPLRTAIAERLARDLGDGMTVAGATAILSDLTETRLAEISARSPVIAKVASVASTANYRVRTLVTDERRVRFESPGASQSRTEEVTLTRTRSFDPTSSDAIDATMGSWRADFAARDHVDGTPKTFETVEKALGRIAHYMSRGSERDMGPWTIGYDGETPIRIPKAVPLPVSQWVGDSAKAMNPGKSTDEIVGEYLAAVVDEVHRLYGEVGIDVSREVVEADYLRTHEVHLAETAAMARFAAANPGLWAERKHGGYLVRGKKSSFRATPYAKLFLEDLRAARGAYEASDGRRAIELSLMHFAERPERRGSRGALRELARYEVDHGNSTHSRTYLDPNYNVHSGSGARSNASVFTSRIQRAGSAREAVEASFPTPESRETAGARMSRDPLVTGNHLRRTGEKAFDRPEALTGGDRGAETRAAIELFVDSGSTVTANGREIRKSAKDLTDLEYRRSVYRSFMTPTSSPYYAGEAGYYQQVLLPAYESNQGTKVAVGIPRVAYRNGRGEHSDMVRRQVAAYVEGEAARLRGLVANFAKASSPLTAARWRRDNGDPDLNKYAPRETADEIFGYGDPAFYAKVDGVDARLANELAEAIPDAADALAEALANDPSPEAVASAVAGFVASVPGGTDLQTAILSALSGHFVDPVNHDSSPIVSSARSMFAEGVVDFPDDPGFWSEMDEYVAGVTDEMAAALVADGMIQAVGEEYVDRGFDDYRIRDHRDGRALEQSRFIFGEKPTVKKLRDSEGRVTSRRMVSREGIEDMAFAFYVQSPMATALVTADSARYRDAHKYRARVGSGVASSGEQLLRRVSRTLVLAEDVFATEPTVEAYLGEAIGGVDRMDASCFADGRTVVEQLTARGLITVGTPGYAAISRSVSGETALLIGLAGVMREAGHLEDAEAAYAQVDGDARAIRAEDIRLEPVKSVYFDRLVHQKWSQSTISLSDVAIPSDAAFAFAREGVFAEEFARRHGAYQAALTGLRSLNAMGRPDGALEEVRRTAGAYLELFAPHPSTEGQFATLSAIMLAGADVAAPPTAIKDSAYRPGATVAMDPEFLRVQTPMGETLKDSVANSVQRHMSAMAPPENLLVDRDGNPTEVTAMGRRIGFATLAARMRRFHANATASRAAAAETQATERYATPNSEAAGRERTADALLGAGSLDHSREIEADQVRRGHVAAEYASGAGKRERDLSTWLGQSVLNPKRNGAKLTMKSDTGVEPMRRAYYRVTLDGMSAADVVDTLLLESGEFAPDRSFASITEGDYVVREGVLYLIGSVVPVREFRKGPKSFTDARSLGDGPLSAGAYVPYRLRAAVPKRMADGTIRVVSEVMIPPRNARVIGVRPTGSRLEARDIGVGVRIPYQSYASGMAMEVVGTLGEHIAGEIVTPAEWVAFSGADFDADAVFGTFRRTRANKTRYGEYAVALAEGRIDAEAAGAMAYDEWLEYTRKHDKRVAREVAIATRLDGDVSRERDSFFAAVIALEKEFGVRVGKLRPEALASGSVGARDSVGVSPSDPVSASSFLTALTESDTEFSDLAAAIAKAGAPADAVTKLLKALARADRLAGYAERTVAQVTGIASLSDFYAAEVPGTNKTYAEQVRDNAVARQTGDIDRYVPLTHADYENVSVEMDGALIANEHTLAVVTKGVDPTFAFSAAEALFATVAKGRPTRAYGLNVRDFRDVGGASNPLSSAVTREAATMASKTVGSGAKSAQTELYLSPGTLIGTFGEDTPVTLAPRVEVSLGPMAGQTLPAAEFLSASISFPVDEIKKGEMVAMGLTEDSWTRYLAMSVTRYGDEVGDGDTVRALATVANPLVKHFVQVAARKAAQANREVRAKDLLAAAASELKAMGLMPEGGTSYADVLGGEARANSSAEAVESFSSLYSAFEAINEELANGRHRAEIDGVGFERAEGREGPLDPQEQRAYRRFAMARAMADVEGGVNAIGLSALRALGMYVAAEEHGIQLLRPAKIIDLIADAGTGVDTYEDIREKLEASGIREVKDGDGFVTGLEVTGEEDGVRVVVSLDEVSAAAGSPVKVPSNTVVQALGNHPQARESYMALANVIHRASPGVMSLRPEVTKVTRGFIGNTYSKSEETIRDVRRAVVREVKSKLMISAVKAAGHEVDLSIFAARARPPERTKVDQADHGDSKLAAVVDDVRAVYVRHFEKRKGVGKVNEFLRDLEVKWGPIDGVAENGYVSVPLIRDDFSDSLDRQRYSLAAIEVREVLRAEREHLSRKGANGNSSALGVFFGGERGEAFTVAAAIERLDEMSAAIEAILRVAPVIHDGMGAGPNTVQRQMMLSVNPDVQEALIAERDRRIARGPSDESGNVYDLAVKVGLGSSVMGATRGSGVPYGISGDGLSFALEGSGLGEAYEAAIANIRDEITELIGEGSKVRIGRLANSESRFFSAVEVAADGSTKASTRLTIRPGVAELFVVDGRVVNARELASLVHPGDRDAKRAFSRSVRRAIVKNLNEHIGFELGGALEFGYSFPLDPTRADGVFAYEKKGRYYPMTLQVTSKAVLKGSSPGTAGRGVNARHWRLRDFARDTVFEGDRLKEKAYSPRGEEILDRGSGMRGSRSSIEAIFHPEAVPTLFDGVTWSGSEVTYDLVPQNDIGPLSMHGVSSAEIEALRRRILDDRDMHASERAAHVKQIREEGEKARAKAAGMSVAAFRKHVRERNAAAFAAAQARVDGKDPEVAARRSADSVDEVDGVFEPVLHDPTERRETWENPVAIQIMADAHDVDLGVEGARETLVAYLKALKANPGLDYGEYVAERECSGA